MANGEGSAVGRVSRGGKDRCSNVLRRRFKLHTDGGCCGCTNLLAGRPRTALRVLRVKFYVAPFRRLVDRRRRRFAVLAPSRVKGNIPQPTRRLLVLFCCSRYTLSRHCRDMAQRMPERGLLTSGPKCGRSAEPSPSINHADLRAQFSE